MLFLGLDFGTESVRAVLVDRSGRQAGAAVVAYRRGQIVPGSATAKELFPGGLPAGFALQSAGDWLVAAREACREALKATGDPVGARGLCRGIGVDFTSCTMLPCGAGGGALCEATGIDATDPHVWPKLWKHHGALSQTERINALARQRKEPWLSRYGGVVGLEWLIPKVFEAVESSAQARGAAMWMEAGDWFVWQLVGGEPVRSTCQAGYKGLWSAEAGYPSEEFCGALHPELAAARRSKLPGRFVAPGNTAGNLQEIPARLMGLNDGIPVSAAIIDAHAGVPGAGVGGPGTLVMVMGTSGCHMIMSERERLVPGVAGVVKDGILPGYFGYETGQAAMGDAFDLVRRLTGHPGFATLDALAMGVPAGAGGVLALDWFNGCRTPLMDGGLKGAFVGLTLETRPEQLYRAALEASAMGLRWIVDTLREGGVPVERFVATGGLSTKNPLFARIAAAVLGAPIEVHPAEHGPALGAAILGALAAGAFRGAGEAVESMAGPKSALGPSKQIKPEMEWVRAYERLYPVYRKLAAEMAGTGSAARALDSRTT